MSDLSRLLYEKNVEFYKDALLADISSFKIGGAADYLVYPDTEEKLIFAVSAAKSLGIKYTVVGNTSNILFSDNGYSGMVLVTRKLSKVSFELKNGEVLLVCGAEQPCHQSQKPRRRGELADLNLLVEYRGA